MSQEINQLLNRKPNQALDVEEDLTAGIARRQRLGKLPEFEEGPTNENLNQFNLVAEDRRTKQTVILGGVGKTEGYSSGQYCGGDVRRSPKLN